MNMEQIAKSQMAVCAKHALMECSNLSHVYVIPIEELGDDARSQWSQKDEEIEKKFNVSLGQCASAFLYRELANRAVPFDKDTRDVARVGISGGRTIHTAIASLPQMRLERPLSILPTVMGPIPEYRFTASTVAAVLQDKVSRAIMDNPFECTILQPSNANQSSSARLQLIDGKRDNVDQTEYDILITGVGGKGCGSFMATAKIVGAKLLQYAEFDVFSRCFDKNCNEVAGERLDAFVVLTKKRIVELAADAEKCRVIAIAGGRNKVEALRALLKTKAAISLKTVPRVTGQKPEERLINTLITDELTAIALLS